MRAGRVMRHAMKTAAPASRCIYTVIIGLVAAAAPAQAQQGRAPAPNPVVADYRYEPPGYLEEPDAITRAALVAERQFGKGNLGSGFYLDFENMIAGAGWIAGGPGYRRWYPHDRLFFEASAGLSWHGYKTAQARVEAPRLLRSRLLLGSQVKLQDFTQVDYFGEGP